MNNCFWKRSFVPEGVQLSHCLLIALIAGLLLVQPPAVMGNTCSFSLGSGQSFDSGGGTGSTSC
jgi:hypothetical protein